jgi:osmotically-inducible protein OsmY
MMAEVHRLDSLAAVAEVEAVVAKQAKLALSRSRIFDLRRLHVEADGESVVLQGRVSSFYHKQLAQEVVRNATDGAEVVNAIRVVYHADRYETERFDRAS